MKDTGKEEKKVIKNLIDESAEIDGKIKDSAIRIFKLRQEIISLAKEAFNLKKQAKINELRLKTNIPAIVKEVRKRSCKNMQEFGLDLGVTKQCISKYEKGESYPSKDKIDIILDLYL